MEALTLYFDRCLGKRVPEALSKLTCPFEVKWHQGEKFADKMPDDEWLDIVGSKGWIVISHDAKWHTEAAAIEAIRQHKVKCFYLYGANSLMFFKVKSLTHKWEKIVSKIKSEKGPFIYRVSKSNRLGKIL